MHWTERGRAVVRIGEELRNRGWTLFGYTEDQSDMQTDYYSPASWSGVATHPELSGTVVCVDVSVSTVNFQSGDNGWPEFKATQHGKTWHVERDCETIYAGVGLAGCSWSSERWHDKVRRVCDHIERVAYGPAQTAGESSTVAATDDYTVTVEHDNDWTWLFFDAKPSQAVRDRLKGMGARWGRKKQGWYFKRNVMDAELAWLTTGDDNDEMKSEGGDNDRLGADPVTGYEPGRGDAFDYIPEWMTIPGVKETEGQVPLAIIKLFTPDSDWTWYVIEYDPQIKEAFGLVARSDWTMTELGYFSLSEMETVTGPLGLHIERDLWFTPKPITDVDGYKAKWENGGPYQAQPKKEAKPDRPEPKFDIGDFVLFEWEPERPERHEITDREYREFEGNWHYKADWKWWGENGLIMAAEAETELSEQPSEPKVSASEKLPTGWTIEDIPFLLEKLKDGPILTATGEFGIPSIHDFPAQTKHLGFGLFEVETAECTFQYDGGTQMHRTPSGHESWTRLRVIEGEYDYPFDEVRANLEAAAFETVAEEKPETAAEVKLKQCLDDRHEIWIGETWEDAIRQSVTTPDCGIEETETGYCLFGWSNGYEQKYTRPIPPVLNTYVEQLLQDQKEAQEANKPAIWEMTRDVFRQRKAAELEAAGHINPQPCEAARFARRSEDEVEQIGEHQLFVEQALAEGKPVTDEALADYPELQTHYKHSHNSGQTLCNRPLTSNTRISSDSNEVNCDLCLSFAERKYDMVGGPAVAPELPEPPVPVTAEMMDMRDLLYDDEGNLRDIDEIDTEKADELLASYMPGEVNGPDKVFSWPPEMPLNKLESGDQVWWEDKAGNVFTGVVDYVATDGNVVVKCNDPLAVAGGVPIGRIEHVKLNLLTRGEPPEILTESEALEILNETTEPGVNPAQTLTVGMLDAVARVQEAVIVPDGKSDAEEDDGIPDFIEVDLGRKYGWATAAVARMRGKWLYYHLTQEHCHKPDRRGGKVQVIGRDILWRSIAVPASQGAQ